MTTSDPTDLEDNTDHTFPDKSKTDSWGNCTVHVNPTCPDSCLACKSSDTAARAVRSRARREWIMERPWNKDRCLIHSSSYAHCGTCRKHKAGILQPTPPAPPSLQKSRCKKTCIKCTEPCGFFFDHLGEHTCSACLKQERRQKCARNWNSGVGRKLLAETFARKGLPPCPSAPTWEDQDSAQDLTNRVTDKLN